MYCSNRLTGNFQIKGQVPATNHPGCASVEKHGYGKQLGNNHGVKGSCVRAADFVDSLHLYAREPLVMVFSYWGIINFIAAVVVVSQM